MAAFSLKATTKGVTALIVVAVVILFGGILAYVGVAGKLKTLTTEMQAKQKRVAESEQIAQKLEKSKLDYLDARSQVRYLEASVSTQEYVPTLLKQLEHLGASVNLKVTGVRPAPMSAKPVVQRSIGSGKQASEGNIDKASEEKTGPQGAEKPKEQPSPYDQIVIDVEAQGHYMSALDFLYRLTSFPKIIAVNEIAMDPPSGSRLDQAYANPALKIKLKLTAFVLKDGPTASDPANVGKPESPAGQVSQSRKEVAGSEAG